MFYLKKMVEYKELQEFKDFELFHRRRTLVDASGYLEACTSFSNYDTRRPEKRILQPMSYEHFLGSPVLNGCDDRLSGNIKRLPENYQEANTQDFSPNTFYMLNTKLPNIDYVRLSKEENGDKQEYILYLYKTFVIDASFIIHRYKFDKNSITIQFAKLPCSRSELFAALTKSNMTEMKAIYKSLSTVDMLTVMADEIEGPFWYEKVVKNIRDSKLSDTLKSKIIKDELCMPISGYYTFPIINTPKTDDTKHWQKAYQSFTHSDDDDSSTIHLTLHTSINFKNANLHSRVKIEERQINLRKQISLKTDTLYKIKKIIAQNYHAVCSVVMEGGKEEIIKWHIPKANVTRELMTTYLSSLLNQSQKMYEKTHNIDTHTDTFESNLLTITDSEKIDLGFLITTDDGLKSGVPLTHSEYDRDKYTAYYSHPYNESIGNELNKQEYYNLAQETIAFQIDMNIEFTENHGRTQILGLLKQLLNIRKTTNPKMLIGFVQDFSDKPFELKQKIITLRCQLMALLKMFPVHFVSKLYENKHDFAPEQEPLITAQNIKNVNVDPLNKALIIDSIICPLVNTPGRAFKNAECLNAAEVKKEELRKHLVKVERKNGNIADVRLELDKEFVKCQSNASWTSDTIFAIGRNLFKNELIPVSKCEEEDVVCLQRIHVHTDTIPIILDDEISYLHNKMFDHPLTMVCPANPVYRCTKYDDGKKYLARPFPTVDDLNSMINFCNETGNKGHLLFHNYGNPQTHQLGCHSGK